MAAVGFGYTIHILEGTECHHSQHLHLVHNMGGSMDGNFFGIFHIRILFCSLSRSSIRGEGGGNMRRRRRGDEKHFP